MSLNLNIDKETTVGELERNFTTDLIGMKFKVKNGMVGKDDELTILSKKPGFGIVFNSKLTGKDYHADSHLWLSKI